MLLNHKLEKALVAYITANRGSLFPGVSIVPGHGDLQPKMPYMAVWCGKTSPHSDFEGCGRLVPETAPVVIGITQSAHDAAEGETVANEGFNETAGLWITALDSLMATPSVPGAASYSALLAALNAPASGPDLRPVPGLYIYAVHPGESSDDIREATWDATLSFEFIAQNGDPSS